MFNKPVPHPKAVNDERGGTGLYIYNESSIHCRVSNPPIVNNNLVKNFCCIVFLLSSFMRSFMRRHSHGLVGYDASLTPMRSRVRFSVIVFLIASLGRSFHVCWYYFTMMIARQPYHSFTFLLLFRTNN